MRHHQVRFLVNPPDTERPCSFLEQLIAIKLCPVGTPSPGQLEPINQFTTADGWRRGKWLWPPLIPVSLEMLS